MNRMQITGLGPVNADGSRKIFDKEPKPFIATKGWLDAQIGEPAVGDYLDVAEDGGIILVKEAGVSAARADAQQSDDPSAQKKTDGGEGLSAGLKASQHKYRAKPIEVSAYEIVTVGTNKHEDGSIDIELSNGAAVVAGPEMLARIAPQRGDYWIVQADGYVYLNPKEVFERKYEPITE